ncbi:hypothetical protein VNO77_25958 [Canavalia gladiata]|uniref:Choline kinase 2 n=1 Tax=Canavalia gladiata TaxID=3824 RepID=A0AAN9KRQ4_CANGL
MPPPPPLFIGGGKEIRNPFRSFIYKSIFPQTSQPSLSIFPSLFEQPLIARRRRFLRPPSRGSLLTLPFIASDSVRVGFTINLSVEVRVFVIFQFFHSFVPCSVARVSLFLWRSKSVSCLVTEKCCKNMVSEGGIGELQLQGCNAILVTFRIERDSSTAMHVLCCCCNEEFLGCHFDELNALESLAMGADKDLVNNTAGAAESPHTTGPIEIHNNTGSSENPFKDKTPGAENLVASNQAGGVGNPGNGQLDGTVNILNYQTDGAKNPLGDRADVTGNPVSEQAASAEDLLNNQAGGAKNSITSESSLIDKVGASENAMNDRAGGVGNPVNNNADGVEISLSNQIDATESLVNDKQGPAGSLVENEAHAVEMPVNSKANAVETPVSIANVSIANAVETPVSIANAVETPASIANAVETPASIANAVETPASIANAVETPASQANAVETPASQANAVEAPVSKENAVETPVSKANAVETPVSNANAVETPVSNANAVETPMSKENAVETPVSKENAVETPVSKENAVETPVSKENAVETPVSRADRIPEEAKEILKSLASQWEDVLDANALQVIPLKGAMTNEVFQIKWPTSAGETSRKVIVRIYGEGVEIFFDRGHEIQTFEFMSKNGQGPRLLGRFANGRVEEFIHARTLSASDLLDPSISALIAAKLKEFHDLDMPGEKKVYLWDILRNWLGEAKRLSSPQEVEAFYLDTIDKEISMLEKELSGTQLIGFCHNDLQYGNIMLDEEANSVTIIDYEYANYNPVAYDIANHFCEMAANYHTEEPHILNFNKYPDFDERQRFVKAYLGTSDNYHVVFLKLWVLYAGEQPGNEVEQLLQEIEKYTLANHLFWGIWGIISAQVNTIDFDYKEYAKQRFQEYWARKPYLLISTDPHSPYNPPEGTGELASAAPTKSKNSGFFRKMKKFLGLGLFKSKS